jgi:phosphatidylserine decarboxylase
MLPDKSRVAASVLRALPRKRLSRGMGRLADLPVPSAVLDRLVDVYVRAYDVDLSECEVPEGGYPSFDAFFTRRLRPGARPLDPDPDALLCPADGRIEAAGVIARGARFDVKGHSYDVGELLGDPTRAATFAGGSFCIVYLSPRDYHRVHVPVTGRVHEARYVAGTLFPVNAIGLRHVPNLFAKNERVAVHQESDVFGEVVSILVGAIGVGRIGVAFDEELTTNVGRPAIARDYGAHGPLLRRGDELGVFHLGSTVILLAPPSAALEWVPAVGAAVRMGTALARRRAPAVGGARA